MDMISVVVPSHNDEQYIEACLDSLIRQTLRPEEIIVCDDASSDGTLEVVRSWQRNHPEIAMIIVAHDEHIGIPRNFNSGLLAASGSLVSILAADDYWKPAKLEREYALITSLGVRWAYSRVDLHIEKSHGNVACTPFQKTAGDHEGDIFDAVVRREVSPRSFLIERRALLETGLFDESIGMYEDWDLKMRLARKYPIAQVREANVVYRQHDAGEHHAPMYRHMAEISKVLRKCKNLIPGDGAAQCREILGKCWPESAMADNRDRAARATALDSLDLPYLPASIGSDGEGMVFLVSLPRSGSTMLQRVLGGHPDIHTTAEPWVMLHPLYALKRQGLKAEYDATECRNALRDFVGALPAGEEGYYAAVRQMGRSLYSQAVRDAGKSRFLDKTPRYIYILQELARAFPRARIVLLLRNPLAILASVLDTWFNRNVAAFESSSNFQDMRDGPRLLADAIDGLGDNVIVTRYEDIIRDTESEVRRICEFVGIPYFSPMLEYGARPAPIGKFGDPRKVNEHTRPVTDYADKWKEVFSDAGLREYAGAYIKSLGGELLSRLGYPMAGTVEALPELNDDCTCATLPSQGLAAGRTGRARRTEELNKNGERLFGEGRLYEAKQMFLEACELDSRNVDTCNNLVVLYWQMKDQERALHYLARALKVDPYYRDTIVNAGQILVALGKTEDARSLCNGYLAKQPGDRVVTELLKSLSPDPDITSGKIRACGVLVTAIVSTYNSEQYIRGCLEDLEAQTIADRIEIIVVDSGSEQNERAIVAEFQQRYSNIRYIRTDERETIYAAWNRAISEATGKYLTNANTDDRHFPGAYERLVSELEANPDTALVYADSAVTRVENTGFAEAPVEAYFRWPDFDPCHLFAVCYIGPQPMWRRSVHEKYGYFDADMTVAGDYDFWLRMAGTEIFRHVPEVLGLYLASANSIEHAYAGAGAAESETARQRNWPAEWGKRPELCKGYLVPVEHDITSSLDDPGMENPYISIIMPTKDRLHLLGRALDSVIAQSYRNWELIIVNDGGESIRHIVDGRDSAGRIRYIEFGWSRGQASARNTALAEARGEIVCYLDDDDMYLSDHLQTIVNEMTREGSSFIYTDAVVVKEAVTGGSVQEVGRSNPYAHAEYSRERLLVNNYIPINTWAHRRACLDEVGVFDSSLPCYEDWEFLLRLAGKYGFRHVEKTTVEVRHRVDQVDNVSRQRLGDTEQAYRDIYARHEKHLSEALQAEREGMLEQLARNIESWTAEGEAADPEHGTARDVAKDSYTTWREQHDLGDRDIARYSRRMTEEWTLQPSIHLVMTHVAGQEAAVADTLDSLEAQLYGGWGLSIVSNAPCPDPVFEEMGNLEWHQVDGDLPQGVNAVARASGAGWLGLLEAGSILEPHLLYQHVDHLHRHPDWRLVYMDEDRIDGDGQRYDPLFRPEFNLELLRAMPYMGNFVLIEREALMAAGAWGQKTGAEVQDAVLRVIEHCGEQAAGHLPDVLIHRQDRFELAQDQDLIVSSRRACIASHLERCGIRGEVKPGTLFGSFFVDYDGTDQPPVEIIVPVSGKPETLELFLDSLFSQTQYPNFRVQLLVKDSIDIPPAVSGRDRVAVASYPQSANRWQALLELARSSHAEHLMLMSPGAIAIQPSWLERLVAQLGKADVAVVAPRLVSSDKTVVGGGIVTGAGSYAVGMGAFAGLALDDSGYMGRAQVAQELSAVSNSCMLVRKSVLVSTEGLSGSLRLGFYQAVEFCLRVRETGGKIVWTPHSTLMFVGEDQSELAETDLDDLAVRETEVLCKQSLTVLASDPAYNPNLALTGKRFTVDDRFIPTWKPDDHTVSRIIGFSAGSIGSWKFRIEQPLKIMSREQVANSLVLPFNKELEQWPSMAELERLQPDTLLMHNTMHDAYMDSMEAYKKINKAFIVFGQDDLMFALPPKNPFFKTGYKDTKKRLRRCLGIADRLVVTTGPLADELGSMVDDVRVVPNYLDESVWGGLTSKRSASEKPRVGWAGAQQHLGDLELLEEVVQETAQEVDWVFFGMCPDFLQPYVKEIHNPVTFGKYPEKLATLNLDLALAPLEYNRFNNSKSNLRILEYGALGWPVIASDIEPYREAPVCRVPNQPRAWIRAIRERIHDMDTTRREGDVLRAWVRENWMLQQHMQEWLAALDPAGAGVVRQRPAQRA